MFEQLVIVPENNNSLIKLKAKGGAIASLTGVNVSQIGASDFILLESVSFQSFNNCLAKRSRINSVAGFS